MLFSFTATVTYEKLNYKLSLIKTNFFTLNFYRQREPCVYIGVVMGNFALTLVLTLLYLDIIEGSTGELNFWHPICKITRSSLHSASHFSQIWGSLHLELSSISFKIRVQSSKLASQEILKFWN